jgi:5-methylcytosine-specific restriction endonuclease McrA
VKESEKFYYKYLIANLRKIFNYSSNVEKQRALKNASGKQIGSYICAECGNTFYRHQVAVDHKQPVMPVEGFDSWSGFIGRLFCDASELQVLCKGIGSCHQKKSNLENAQRRNHKKNLKKGTKDGTK